MILSLASYAQTSVLQDDFEGNGNITNWFGFQCDVDINLPNPFSQGINTSATVMEYHDKGGQFALVGFNPANNLDLSSKHSFTMHLYVPSNGLTGNLPNEVALKLQDGGIGNPWMTQSEIIKPIVLDQWQVVTFDFLYDPYINFDPNSLSPVQRTDFNRVIIQLNGEDNSDQVVAYIDNFEHGINQASGPSFNQLVWSDEFNGTGAVDNNKWHHQTQFIQPGGWANGELQHYTNRTDNSWMYAGHLRILAKKEQFTDQGFTKSYTSARLNSKFAFKYGRVEVRAKLPTGAGTWPAIWMLGKSINEDGGYWDNLGFGAVGWPACGEVDILEHWGNNQNYVQSALHTPSSFGGTINHGGRVLPTASSGFHVYTLEWTKDLMIFSVDSIVHYVYNPAVKDTNTWPFNSEQYILLNIAIEANVAASFSSSSMEIDYVRIYQESGIGTDEIDNESTLTHYPNPVKDQLNLELDRAAGEDLSINILTIDGRPVRSLQLKADGQIIEINDLSSLPRGMYIVSCASGVWQEQFVILKD